MVEAKPQDTGSIKSGDWYTSFLRETLGPLFLMSTTPAFSIIFFYVCSTLDGNFLKFGSMCYKQGLFSTVFQIWPTPWDPVVWKMILGFMALQLCLMRFIPGRSFTATTTAGGNVPIYKANGVASYLITLFILSGGAYFVSFKVCLSQLLLYI